MNVADGKEETYWRVNDFDSGHWVMVDLEGRKPRKQSLLLENLPGILWKFLIRMMASCEMNMFRRQESR